MSTSDSKEPKLDGVDPAVASGLSRPEIEALVELLTGASEDGLWWLDYRTERMYANPSLARALGYEPQELDASIDDWRALIHQEDRRRIAEVWRVARESSKPARYIARIRGHDGSYHQTSTLGRVFYGDDGQPRVALGYVRDLTSRRRSVAMAERFFDRALDILALISFDHRIELANGSWKTRLGWDPAKLVGCTLDELVHPHDLANTRLAIQHLRGGGEVDDLRQRVKREDGSYSWICWSFTPLVEDGVIVSVGRDLTQELAQQAELVRAREAALAGSRAKSEFLATMSHEIRTPLNGVLGATTLLLDGDLDDQQHVLVKTIRSAGQALLRILNDVLDLSKIEAGRLSTEAIGFDPRRLVLRTAELFRPDAAEKGVALRVIDPPFDLPVTVTGDPTRLRQVLVNLLSNALKFTEHGEIVVCLDRTQQGDEDYLTIAVSDSGCGIAAADLALAFEPFRQLDTSNTRRHGGTGLGLAISRRLTELMGGTLSVQSQLGQGSTFTIEIPLVDAEEPTQTHSDSGHAHVAVLPDNPHVLLAEDNQINQLVARGMLEKLGCQVTIAADGATAVGLAQAKTFDAVLMDCQMPVMDGYNATRALRALPGRRVPVIALTAHAYAEDRQRCLRAGMDDFLTKPIEISALRSTLGKWLDIGRGQSKIARRHRDTER